MHTVGRYQFRLGLLVPILVALWGALTAMSLLSTGPSATPTNGAVPVSEHAAVALAPGLVLIVVAVAATMIASALVVRAWLFHGPRAGDQDPTLQAHMTANGLARLLRMAREDERNRLAQDLHDDVLGTLNALRLQQPIAVTNHAVVGAAEAAVRRIVRQEELLTLRSAGLRSSIEAYLDPIRNRTMDLVFCVDELLGRPPWEIEVAVLRIVQQAVTNATEHGGADRIVVAGLVAPDAVSVHIINEGLSDQRCDTDASLGTGIGLLSMQQRAQEIGASLTVIELDSGGRRIDVTWRR